MKENETILIPVTSKAPVTCLVLEARKAESMKLTQAGDTVSWLVKA